MSVEHPRHLRPLWVDLLTSSLVGLGSALVLLWQFLAVLVAVACVAVAIGLHLHFAPPPSQAAKDYPVPTGYLRYAALIVPILFTLLIIPEADVWWVRVLVGLAIGGICLLYARLDNR